MKIVPVLCGALLVCGIASARPLVLEPTSFFPDLAEYIGLTGNEAFLTDSFYETAGSRSAGGSDPGRQTVSTRLERPVDVRARPHLRAQYLEPVRRLQPRRAGFGGGCRAALGLAHLRAHIHRVGGGLARHSAAAELRGFGRQWSRARDRNGRRRVRAGGSGARARHQRSLEHLRAPACARRRLRLERRARCQRRRAAEPPRGPDAGHQFDRDAHLRTVRERVDSGSAVRRARSPARRFTARCSISTPASRSCPAARRECTSIVAAAPAGPKATR